MQEATTTLNVLVQGALSIELVLALSILKGISSHIYNRLRIDKLDHSFNTQLTNCFSDVNITVIIHTVPTISNAGFFRTIEDLQRT